MQQITARTTPLHKAAPTKPPACLAHKRHKPGVSLPVHATRMMGHDAPALPCHTVTNAQTQHCCCLSQMHRGLTGIHGSTLKPYGLVGPTPANRPTCLPESDTSESRRPSQISQPSHLCCCPALLYAPSTQTDMSHQQGNNRSLLSKGADISARESHGHILVFTFAMPKAPLVQPEHNQTVAGQCLQHTCIKPPGAPQTRHKTLPSFTCQCRTPSQSKSNESVPRSQR